MSIQTILEANEDLRTFLFVKGFLLTDNDDVPRAGYPFYGLWPHHRLGKYHVWHHPETGYFTAVQGEKTCFLFGHAYNPFTMETDEKRIVERILCRHGEADFYDCVDELTGLFVLGIEENGQLTFLNDPAGIHLACCGQIGTHFYLASHAQLVADLCGLKMDPFVEELVEYKWYGRVMGPYLPADLTAFQELKRVVPNQAYTYDGIKTITHIRFYPLKDLPECKNQEEYQKVIEQAADILKKNMELVAKKWDRPWISLTGGIDSNTTFAAANGLYDRIAAFSYVSAPKETIDRDAAKVIAERFGVHWEEYQIPETTDGLDRYEEKVAILRHNNAYVAKEKDNELRKRVYLQENCPAEVEVKSWISETIRGYWYKHFGRTTMPKLSAKLYRNLYKIFLENRTLAHKVDKVFAQYIEAFEYQKIPAQYPPADMHFNEVTWGSWGSLNIGEMRFCQEITIIFNNRRFLDLLFRVPLEKRISDRHHLDMKQYMNQELYDMNIRVVNMHETKFRAFALNMIFTINSILP